MTAGIYALWFGKCKKPYIGQSIGIEARIRNHIVHLQRSTTRNDKMQNAYNKYGELSWQILEELDPVKDVLNQQEIWWFDYFGGFKGTLNCVEPGNSVEMPMSVKRNMSNARRVITDKQIESTFDLPALQAGKLLGVTYVNIIRRRRIFQGLCGQCGINSLTDHTSTCNSCYDRIYRR